MAKGDRIKLRFCTNRVKQLCDKLADDQKDFLRDNGLGHFLNLSVFTVSIPLLDFVMRNFQIGINEFQVGNKSIRFSKTMMKQNLGFLCGDTPVDIRNVPADLLEEAKSIEADYNDDSQSKPSIRKAIRLCLQEHNEQAFIRHFFMVALSTMIAPNSQNSLEIHLLKFLMRQDQIFGYDWAGYAFDYIKIEIERFQRYIHSSDPELQNMRHTYGSCLPLLTVVYMDFLNLSTDFGDDHAISYALPRFCHVKTKDFAYVYEADHVRFPVSERTEFGVVPFRDFSTTPYACGLDDVAAGANINQPVQQHTDSDTGDAEQHEANFIEDDHHALNNATGSNAIVVFFKGAKGGTSCSRRGGLLSVPSLEVPPSIQPIVDEHYAQLVSKATSIIGDYESSVQKTWAELLSKSFASLSCEVLKIQSSSDNKINETMQQTITKLTAKCGEKDSELEKKSADNCFLQEQLEKKNAEIKKLEEKVFSLQQQLSSSVDISPEQPYTHCHNPISENNSLQSEKSNDDNLLNLDENLVFTSPETPKKRYITPIQHFYKRRKINKAAQHVMKEDISPEKKTHEGDNCVTSIPNGKASGGKENEQSHNVVASSGAENSSLQSIKTNDASLWAFRDNDIHETSSDDNDWTNHANDIHEASDDDGFRSKQNKFPNDVGNKSQVSIPLEKPSIDLGKCSYGHLLDSLSPGGFISPTVMDIFAQVINLGNKYQSENKSNISKICFPTNIGLELAMEWGNFSADKVKTQLLGIDKQFNIINADLLFFPFCFEQYNIIYWFALCCNFLHDKVHIFQESWWPLPSESIPLQKTVLSNFTRICREAKIFDRPLQKYDVVYYILPFSLRERFDCGVYVMMAVDNFDGDNGEKVLKLTQADEFRKVIAHRIINRFKFYETCK